jgi:hypothetical protein
MNEGATTWALVVGIDEYDSPLVPKLKGAAADAAAAVTWLRRLGVPDGQIFLHAAPATESKGLVEGLGIPFKDGRDATIWSSVSKFLDVTDGTRLFVFLCGHGLYEPSTKRIFLTQEAGVDRVYSNLGIDLYIDLFLSTVFPRQFLIMDGCLNLPYSPAERQKIRAAMRNGIDPAQFTPRPGNSLIACFGAAQGQRVVEISGRGAFMRRLLKAMDPDSPAAEATTLDWTTGRLEVDILNVMTKGVASQVEADANNLTPRVQQTPQPLAYGFRRIDGHAPMFELAPKTPVTLEVRVKPTAAAPDLTSIHLWVDEPPFQLSFQQPDQGATQVTPPVLCRVPPSLDIRAECRSRRGTPWARMAELRLHEDADRVVVFDMTPPTPAPGGQTPRVPPPDVLGAAGDAATVGMRATTILESRGVREGAGPGVGEAHYGVKLSVGSFGWGGLTGAYNALESKLGYDLDKPAMITGDGSPWLKLNRGMLMQRHEDGPEFRVKPGSVIQARRVVSEWAEAIRNVVPPNVTVHTIIEDVGATPSPPNLRLAIPGGARGLAGALAGHPTVYIGPPERGADPVWRTKSGRSLTELEADPAIRVDPGPVEVRVDLPWGSWSRVVKAPSVRKAVKVTLPRQIGSPPLRVRLSGQATPDEYTIFGVHGPALTGRLMDVSGQTQAVLIPKEAGFASWALGLPVGTYPGKNSLVELSGYSAARFPAVRGWSVAVDWSDKGLRVEPLSSLASPVWDLLVATGRLDSLTTQDAIRLTEDKWFDAILGLAGAYAVYAAADWTYLTVVTENLRRVERTGVDVDLLSIAANREDRERLPAKSVELLGQLAQEQHMPVMRWGVALALELLTAARLQDGAWGSNLSQISRTISPISPWTAWTV